MRGLVLVVACLAVSCGSVPETLAPSPVASPNSPSPSMAQPAIETLAEYARRIQGEDAYGLYFGGKKAGWSVITYRVERRHGREVLVDREEFRLQLSMGGETNTLTQVSEDCYALEGDGPVLWARQETDEDGTRTLIEVQPAGEGLEIVSRTGDRTTRRRARVEQATLRHSQEFEQWLGRARPGESFSQWTVDWTEEPVEQADTVTFQAREPILWGGIRTEANRVLIEHKGGRMEALLQADGTPWKASVSGLIEMRAEDLATAKRLDKPVDMLDVTAIEVQRPLQKPEDLERLVLEVEGTGDFQLPVSHRQRVFRQDGKTLWEIRRDFRVGRKQPLTAAERKAFLKATPALQQDEVIGRLARRIAGQGTPVERAERLQDWIFRNLAKTYGKNAETARDVLDNRAGDCTEHARLFTAMARSLGIPAREVGGLVSAAPQPALAWHAWAEIHDGHQWISVDPMWNQTFVDATHIKMAGSDELSWVNVAGTMRVNVR